MVFSLLAKTSVLINVYLEILLIMSEKNFQVEKYGNGNFSIQNATCYILFLKVWL